MDIKLFIATIYALLYLFASPCYAKASANINTPKPLPSELAHKNIAKIERIMADSVPEEQLLIENLIIEAIRNQPNYAEAFAELTRLTLWQVATGLRPPSELFLALEYAEQVKALAEARPLGAFLVCETLFALNRSQEAEVLCHRTEQQYPEHSDTLAFKARFYADENPKLALESAQSAISKGVSLDALSSSITHAIIKLNPGEKLGKALENFAIIYPDRWIWHRAGLAFVETKQYLHAKAAFEKAISLGNNLESRLQLAIISQNNLKDYQTAIEQYKKILENLSKNNHYRQNTIIGVMARLSIAQLEAGQPQEAIKEASLAMHTDVTATSVIQSIFETFTAKKLSHNLANAMEFVAEQNPYFIFAHLALARLAKQNRDYHKSIRLFSKAIALSENQDEIYSERAHAFYELKNYQNALLDFDAAIQIKPEVANYHYNKACMLSLLGKIDDAVASLRTALIFDVKLAKSAKVDTDLIALRSDQNTYNQLVQLGVFTPETNNDAKVTLGIKN